jgi:NAD(P)-dependent dehydrogenase (short-subunit alcohol dehydrogenase family)
MPVAIVTGANRGIGLELAKALKSRGTSVIATCRKSSKELDALGVRVEAGVEVTSDAAVQKLDARLGDAKLDLLVANQGILRADSLENLDLDAVREQIEVNAIGTLRLVHGLRKRLTKGAKVVLVTSRMGSIGDNSSGRYYGYRMSKAALNAAGASLAHDLKPAGIAVVIVHPGFVKTDMTAQTGTVEPAHAAAQIVARIDALTIDTTGRFLHANGETLPW